MNANYYHSCPKPPCQCFGRVNWDVVWRPRRGDAMSVMESMSPEQRSARARRAALARHAKHDPATTMEAVRAARHAKYDTPEKRHALAMKAAAASVEARKTRKPFRGMRREVTQALRHLQWMREELDSLEETLRSFLPD